MALSSSAICRIDATLARVMFEVSGINRLKSFNRSQPCGFSCSRRQLPLPLVSNVGL